MELTAESIREYVDNGSFRRGKEYFLGHRVLSIEIKDHNIFGTVKGSQPFPYEAELLVKDGKIIDSQCSCPMEEGCKHVVAVGLKALPQLIKEQENKISTNINQIQSERWINELSKIIEIKDNKKETRMVEIQILFMLEPQKIPYAFNHEKDDMGEKLDLLLVARPRMFDPKTNKTSMGLISWQKLHTNYAPTVWWNNETVTFSEDQFEYINLVIQSLQPYGFWAKIADKKASYFWHLLSKHQKYGISLLAGEKGEETIQINTELIQIELAIEEKEGKIVLQKKIFLAGKNILTEIIFVGDPPIFAVIAQNGLQFYPVEDTRGIIKHFAKPFVIPEKDIRFFEKEYLPLLVKQYGVKSYTSRVPVPKSCKLSPGIKIIHIKNMAIQVLFCFIYEKQTFTFEAEPDILNLGDKTVIVDKDFLNKQKEQIRNIMAENNMEFIDLSTPLSLTNISAAIFYTRVFPKLLSAMPDLIITQDKTIPTFIEDNSTPEISLSINENINEHDWFDLGISVSIGTEIVPFSELFTSLVENREYFLLESGRFFSLKNPKLQQLKELIHEAKSIRDKKDSGLKISRFQAGLWDELQKLGIVKEQAEKWSSSMKGLLAMQEIELLHPVQINAELRPYQKEGFSWMAFLHQQQLGGILADDMGLGKTVQSIALIALLKSKEKKKQTLIIAPTSVVENWDSEFKRFAPKLNLTVFRAGDRTEQYNKLTDSDIVITSYPLLIRDFEKIKKINFDVIFLDEAQFVKNYQSKAYSLIRQLKAESKIALSGTPMENNLMELWSLMSIVAPGLFSEPKKFQEMYRTPIEKQQNPDILKRFRARIRPFMMRRQKTVVEKQLPVKNEQITFVQLDKEHRHIYDLYLQHERKRILGLMQDGGFKNHRFEILKSLTKMRQICLHPALVDQKYKNISATKLEYLKEQLKEIISEGHRVLIFSQFTSFLFYVKQLLEKENINYLYLDGKTKQRGDMVKQFQTDASMSVFVISLKAGGIGLNLTAADYCILLDPWWNPAVEQQAVDRTHRIGQTKPVFVYKFIAKNTIEEKVLQLQQKKQKLFKNIMEDENLFGSVISENDIKGLFETGDL